MSLPSVSVRLSELISANNGGLISMFLMGSYTVVYLETLYIYVTRKSPQRVIVLCAITFLFLMAVIQFGIQWYTTETAYTPQMDSNSISAYIALFDTPKWIIISMDATSFAMYIVADGLLIWRCYHVYGDLRRIIIFPLSLLAVEIGLVTTSIIFFLMVDSNASQHEIDISNDLQSGVFFSSFATSLSTTVLIAHKIYTSSQNVNSAKKRFVHILEIIIQSAVIYSAVLLVAAVSGAVPDGESWPSPAVFALANYSSCLLAPAAGMAPTIMVARVSLASSSDDETTLPERRQLSQLQFHRSNQVTTNETSQMEFRFSDENKTVEFV